jgi:hypothetical protein
VYIAAFAPDEGETVLSISAQFPPLEVYQHLLVDAQGFAWIDPAVFPQHFAADVEPTEAQVLAVSQVPTAASILDAKAAQPAWKSLSSWFLVSANDQIIHLPIPHAVREACHSLPGYLSVTSGIAPRGRSRMVLC